VLSIFFNTVVIILGNKSESKDVSEEKIQVPSSVDFENTGAIPKIKSVKDGKIYFTVYKYIYICAHCNFSCDLNY